MALAKVSEFFCSARTDRLAVSLLGDDLSALLSRVMRVLCASGLLSLALAGCGGGAGSNAGGGSGVSASAAVIVVIPTISGTAATSVVVGQVYTFTPTTTNPSGGTLSFSIVNQPTWASFNTTTGQLTGTPTASDVGPVANIVISVSDGISSASLAGFTIVVQSATTGSATVGVVAPTTRTDGTPLTNLAGYHIYYGTTPGVYTNVITVTDPTITSYVVTNLPAGATYYFAATVYDADGIESNDSAVASKTI